MKLSKLEDENFDYKEKIDQSFGKTVCAYANTNGGKIIVGISKKGKIVGTTQKEEEKATNIMENCKPPIKFRMKWGQRDGKNILIIDIPRSDRIHTWKGIAYKRSGSSSTPMDAQEIIELGRKRGDIRFDEEICKEARITDIDDGKVKWFLQTARIKRGFPLGEDIQVRDALYHLNLMKDDKITNAAILLFGRNPQRFHLQAEAKCIHFHGAEIEKPFESYQIYKSNIFDQVGNAVGFVLDRLIKPVIPVPGKVATERPYEIPEFVIREAIVNAIAHRNYYSTGGVQVMVFSDRIEIWNPGGLPPGLTIDVLKKPHPSLPRNKLIAECFHLSRYIEKAGSGIIEMVKQCKEKGLPEPEFEEKMGCFVTTIWRYVITAEYLEGLGLNKRQKEILEYLKAHKPIKSLDYSKKFGITDRQARVDLSKLVEIGLLKREGKARLIIYKLNPEISGNIRKYASTTSKNDKS